MYCIRRESVFNIKYKNKQPKIKEYLKNYNKVATITFILLPVYRKYNMSKNAWIAIRKIFYKFVLSMQLYSSLLELNVNYIFGPKLHFSMILDVFYFSCFDLG